MKNSKYKNLILALFYFVLSIVLISCNQKKEHDNERMMLATLYQQIAPEVRAMQYQTYNQAKFILDKLLSDNTSEKPLAIVVDIDETVLDNSPYQANAILHNFSYPENWDQWCMLAKAKPIAGAVDFLNYADSKGIAVFYISNRKENLLEATIKNLADYNFPQVKEERILLRTDKASKTIRRNIVEENFEIIMLFGDNMNDFFDYTEEKSIEKKFEITDSLKNLFGVKYFALPNAMYGDWEAAIYNYDYSGKEEERATLRNKTLIGY